MKLLPVKTLTDIQQGDMLLIEGHFSEGGPVQVHAAQVVKVTDCDGTEIVFDKKRNHFFNLDMYLAGTSWVKSLSKINTTPATPSFIGVDFNGLRRSLVGSYNNLVYQLNSCLQDGRLVDVFPSDIADDLDRLRGSLAVLVSMYSEGGGFDSLDMHIESFDVDTEEGV